MNKDFQLEILRRTAKYYPHSATVDLWNELVAIAPGESKEAKSNALVAHLMALQELGYIEGFQPAYNLAHFYITAQGLVAAGENILHPDNIELVQAIRELSNAVRSFARK